MASIDETMKIERGIFQLRAAEACAETVEGEAPEIYPFLGTSRMAEVIARHGADLVRHGRAHHGRPEV